MRPGKYKNSGFTIIELLIVIVVVGILATIVIVSYLGVQERSRNAARVAAAQQIVNLLQSYKSVNGDWPTNLQSNGGYCMTQDNNCTDWSGAAIGSINSTVMAELKTVGTPPPSAVTLGQTQRHGFYADAYDVRYFQGTKQGLVLIYWLEGIHQDCKLQNVAIQQSGGAYPTPQMLIPSPTNYSEDFNAGPNATFCLVSIP